MVLNAAVQMLREADELKQKILKFKSGTSMLQERSLWVTQQQLQKVYQKVLVLDLDYALEKKVEQDLWNVGFKQQIEALQAISKDRKSHLRSEGQAMLAWVLQAAAGFYLCLLHQICTTFKLDLPFRRRASLLGWVEGWGAGEATGGARLPPPAAARYICQHCLVHLGDLARYRQQLRVAHTFYRHALVVSAHSGQPYNQLALVAWRRGRRLGALYWHVRSLLVRAPFPPAPANLARTLAAAAGGSLSTLPVLPGVSGANGAGGTAAGRLHAPGYVTALIRAAHMIHNVEQLETAETIVESLNSSLTALIATDSFESMTLIKMSCVLIWLVHSSNEDFKVDRAALSDGEAQAARLSEELAAAAILALLLPAYTLQAPPERALPAQLKVDRAALSEGEAQAARLSEELAAAAMLALLLPAYTLQAPPERALPALKVWLQWCVQHTEFMRGAAWRARAALWPALAHTLNALAPLAGHVTPHAAYETVPLPEDEELHGFLPLEEELKPLRFANHAAWDAYGGRVPDVPESAPDDDPPAEVPASCLSSEPELERRLRALRLVRLGRRLAEMFPEHLQCNEEDGVRFTATSVGGEQLSAALAELSLARAAGGEGADEGEGEGEDDSDDEPERAPPPIVISEADFREKGSLLRAAPGEAEDEAEGEDDSDDEPERAPPPIVISEADFREKVREKRVGILKPQGSLERAREERAMASTQDDPESDGAEDISKSEDKKDLRKPRVNIAMAAIMRKQEESNKQVKFVTPPPTPDTPGDSTEAKDQDKPKVIQPKAIKNLANLPLGRKTGGILSLKDKSAGYPHLQNTDPEPPKKDKEDKKEPKPNQGSSQNSQQSYQPKRQDMPPPNWSPNMPPPNIPYDGPRVNFQKNYGIQNAGISYNPNYPSPPNVNNRGIRLPVVNPKEIDVRTAALQKQNSRQELFQDGHKFGNYSYHVSGDKKNFLNDLPPRFANQYRNWQAAQDSQFNDNKFRDDSFKPNALFNSQQPNWANPPPENYPTQPMPWWKPENPPPNFSNSPSYSPAMGMQPNFYSHVAPNLPNYQNMPSFNQMQNQSVGQQKPENVPNYLPSTIGQPQLQTLQNMVSSPNFNSSLNNFGSYAPTVGYDSAMYPQFNNNKVGYQPMQMKMMDKPSMEYQANKNLMDIGGLGFGSTAMDMQQRNLGIKFPDNMTSDNGAKNMDPIASGSSTGEVGGNTYSLFSGAPDSPAWGASHHHPQQSLWSGPGPSPLERLLEQQKQLKQPPAPH